MSLGAAFCMEVFPSDTNVYLALLWGYRNQEFPCMLGLFVKLGPGRWAMATPRLPIVFCTIPLELLDGYV